VSADDSDTVKAEKLRNMEILANKKPYFFIYNYDRLHREYQRYKTMSNWSCWIRFGMSIDELLEQKSFTEDMQVFLDYYYQGMPISSNPSVCNKICWEFEKRFDTIEIDTSAEFDYSIYMSGNTRILSRDKREVSTLLKKYNELLEKSFNNEIELSKEDVREYFMAKLLSIGNIERMTDVLIDISYKGNKGKQFLWDMCAKQIFKNLLHKNGNFITIPRQCESGEHNYNGNNYVFERVQLEVDDEK
jgi:hypothetical protein